MRKFGYKLVVLFLLCLALIPWVEGLLFQSRYDHLIELVNNDARFRVQILSFDRGWFHSHAKIHVTVNQGLTDFYQLAAAPGRTPVQIAFDIDEEICHGPIIYDALQHKFELGYAKITNNIHIPQALDLLFAGTLSSVGDINIVMLSEFDGDWAGSIMIPTMNLTIHDLAKVTWRGLNGDFKIILGDDYIKMSKFNAQIQSILIDSVSVSADSFHIMIRPSEYQYKLRHKKTGLISGYVEMITPDISFLKSGETNYAINDFEYHTAFSMDQTSLYNTNLSMNVKDIKLASQVTPDISDFHFLITASNFSTSGLFAYLEKFKTRVVSDGKPVDAKLIESLLVHTITPSSLFRGEVSMNTPLGPFACHFKSSWLPNLPAPNTFPDIVASADTKFHLTIAPALLMKMAEVYHDVVSLLTVKDGKAISFNVDNASNKSAPPAASEQSAQQLIDDLVLGGFISKDNNNNYVTKLALESGVWKLNGRPIN